ncbi:MAG: hypothetical protein EA342_00260, partial [Leptolyngbya sp. LCM1.Bin17]
RSNGVVGGASPAGKGWGDVPLLEVLMGTIIKSDGVLGDIPPQTWLIPLVKEYRRPQTVEVTRIYPVRSFAGIIEGIL